VTNDNRPAARFRIANSLVLLGALGGGWLLRDAYRPSAATKPVNPFVERAAASHRTTLLRGRMSSQSASLRYDRRELSRTTGIVMPRLPRGWTVGDVQLYPSTYGDLIHVSLRSPEHETVSLVAMRIDTPAEGSPILDRRAGDRIAYWEKGDAAFALVGRTPERRLIGMAAEIAAGA
jgi:hypothetical protein